jgi:hypothetical protein
MAPDERAAMKAAFTVHYFVRVIHPLGEAIVAIPKAQATEEKKAAVELWHGSTVRLS